MEKENRDELLLQIKNEVVALKKGDLSKLRKKTKMMPVIGEGSLNAKIFFIGEAPGKKEAESGKPFCGASGKVLTQMVESVGLSRENVYITNLVKDRPPENRDPLPVEIKLYAPFLDRQINIIQPKIIATLGRFSMAYIMNKFGLASELKNISQIHGKMFDAKASYGDIKIVTLYHPAVALYNGGMRKQLVKDLEVVKNIIPDAEK